jgi:hypothetical protein
MSDAASATGYSGKPLWQKLGLKDGSKLLLIGDGVDYRSLVGLSGIEWVDSTQAYDIAHIFARESALLRLQITELNESMTDDAIVWVSWPKKTSRVATDITEDTIRALALPLGLVDIKVCAVDAVWSALKLVRRRENRKPANAKRTVKPRNLMQ